VPRLCEQLLDHVAGAASRAHLVRRGVHVALTGVAEGAARGIIERQCHAIGGALRILEQSCGDDQPPPRDQPLRRGEPGRHQPLREQFAPQTQHGGQIVGLELLVRACHAQEQGVAHRGLHVGERRTEQLDRAARLRLVDDRAQPPRIIILVGEHESLHAEPARFEEVVRTGRGG
jgi:hypothetical protein